MTDTATSSQLSAIIDQAMRADIDALRSYLLSDPSVPLVATGSGGAETAAALAALLYGARGGVATAVSPYSLHSFSDRALSTAKVLVVSKGGHNNDAVFASRRALEASPGRAAGFFLSDGDRNEARKLFLKAAPERGFLVPMKGVRDGFVSTGTSIAYFALLVRLFQDSVRLDKYRSVPEAPFRLRLKDGTPLDTKAFRMVTNYIILSGSWGRPVALNLEGKLVETGVAGAEVYDFRNYCHGRFIYTSNHLEDSAVVMLVSPREKELAGRIREFLPAKTKLVLIETECNAPESALDLLIRSTELFLELCNECGADPASPSNLGHIDKRKPISIPFIAEMKAQGPLTLNY